MRRDYTFARTERGGACRATCELRVSPVLVLRRPHRVAPLVAIGSRREMEHVRRTSHQLRAAKQQLEAENSSYRAATGELTAQIQSRSRRVINDLRRAVGSSIQRSRERCRSCRAVVPGRRATGGTEHLELATCAPGQSLPISSPEDTFGVLRLCSQALESRLSYVRRDVEKRAEWQPRRPRSGRPTAG